MWGNPDWYQHKADANNYKPAWEKDVDRHPDHSPSFSKVITSVVGGPDTPTRVIRVYQVRGLGVIIQEALKDPSEDGKLVFEGISIISKEDVGYAPSL